MNSKQNYKIIVHQDYDESFVAECLEVPVIVQGKSDEEIKEKMKDAISGYFEVFPEEYEKIVKNRKTLEITM
jgi:predicted RNase H-like HicB family nuclease